MRAIALISVSAVLLSGCLTTQENPNYEFSSRYEGQTVATQSYASAPAAQTTAVTYETTPVQNPYGQPAPAQSSYVQTAPTYDTYVQPAVSQPVVAQVAIVAPTDSAYASQDVTGTPGFMALHGGQANAVALAPALPAAQIVSRAPLRAAGTPVAYDTSQNFIVADIDRTSTGLADTVIVLPREGNGQQTYIVQPGDTVYSLSRKTCIGVSVIQSMNGLDANYAIKIGQNLSLPASVC